MEPFATVDDYGRRYVLPEDVDALEEALLDATDIIRTEMAAAGIACDEPDESLARTLMRVCRDMVHRAVGDADEGGDAPPIPFGASQFSQGAGSYTQSATLANPYGDLFMTEAERRSLGIGLPRACVVSPYGGDA